MSFFFGTAKKERNCSVIINRSDVGGGGAVMKSARTGQSSGQVSCPGGPKYWVEQSRAAGAEWLSGWLRTFHLFRPTFKNQKLFSLKLGQTGCSVPDQKASRCVVSSVLVLSAAPPEGGAAGHPHYSASGEDHRSRCTGSVPGLEAIPGRSTERHRTPLPLC